MMPASTWEAVRNRQEVGGLPAGPPPPAALCVCGTRAGGAWKWNLSRNWYASFADGECPT
jgi:hypothetical protein